MKSILPEALEDRIEIFGGVYRLRTSVWRVMQATDALQDDELLPEHRAELAAWHLFRWPRPPRRQLSEAVDRALKFLTPESPYRSPKGKRALDIRQDAAMLCAAFRQQYGISLPEEALRLDWREFLALLGGITNETRMGEIMSIRVRELPKRTAHNGEVIRELQRLKAIYALRPGRGGHTFENGLLKMVEILAAMAETK